MAYFEPPQNFIYKVGNPVGLVCVKRNIACRTCLIEAVCIGTFVFGD